jgi:hypothetical protein
MVCRAAAGRQSNDGRLVGWCYEENEIDMTSAVAGTVPCTAQQIQHYSHKSQRIQTPNMMQNRAVLSDAILDKVIWPPHTAMVRFFGGGRVPKYIMISY